jgi:hypothetical protein
MRGCARPWLATSGFVLCGLMRAASAQAAVAFEWLAPAGCPSAAAVQAEVDGLLGGGGARARKNLSVRATVERGPLWTVTLETQSSATQGHRTIEAVTCQALASATALIVALMIDPDAVAAFAKKEAQSEPGPPPSPPAAPAPPSPPAAPPPLSPSAAPPSPSAPAARATFGLVGLGVAGNLGVLPGPDFGVTATVGLVHGHWRAELRGAYGLRTVSSDPVADAGGAYGSFRFLAGTLAGCWVAVTAALDFGPCLEVEFGAVRGEGVGQIQVSSESSPWLGLGAGGAVILKATPWLRFPLHVDAVVPLWRPSYVFREGSPIFRAWPVGGRLTAGVEARF